MAKETQTTKALLGPRELKTMVPNYIGYYPSDLATANYPSQNGWSSLATPSVNSPRGVYYETTVDVNLALDDLTMFPQAMFLQDPGVYFLTAGVPGTTGFMTVLDIVSNKKLDMETIALNLNVDESNNTPGMLGSIDDFNQIIMGNYRMMAKDNSFESAIDIQTTLNQKDFSSASPFAQDTLWVYRLVVASQANQLGYALAIPASRFVMQVMVGQEDDLAYMMRLKNSYELQQL